MIKEKKALQKAVGKRIKELREEKKMAQQTLAAACNFEKSNMARLEAGNTNPTIWTWSKIADSLSVTLKELVDFE